MDTWFTHAPLIESIQQKGLQVIGMVKQVKQRYRWENKELTLSECFNRCKNKKKKGILGSLHVSLSSGLQVKLVFVQNRNKKSEWLAILSTDCSLTNEEIVRIYGIRWQIETFFKFTKSYLKLVKEFQGRSYDMLISHTTIVFARYLLLTWESRQEADQKTLGGLFYLLCDEVKDMDLQTALQLLWSFVQEITSARFNKKIVQLQLQQWIASLPNYIKVCLPI